MLRRTYSVIAALLLSVSGAFAQSGEYASYSPYSVFGIGNLADSPSAYTAGMAGTGIASRNNRYFNTINPAAVSVRDSLALMIDFSLYNTNTIFSQTYGGVTRHSANNTTNIGGFAITFPIWNKMAGYLGLKPYSSVGYTFQSSQADADAGVVTQTHTGLGSLYNVYGGVSHAFGKRFSLGAEADYIFGRIDRNFVQDIASSGYNEAKNSYVLILNAFTGKFGAQYEQPIGKDLKLAAGATYTLRTNLHGFNNGTFSSAGSVQEMVLPSSYADTLGANSGVSLAGEIGVGISVNYKNKMRAEFDYIRSDWRSSGMDSAKGFAVSNAPQSFENSVRESYRLGFEYVPNISDVRYYHRRIAYRAGAFYNTAYYTVAGRPVNTAGITIGATLPVFRWYNGLSISAEIGQRGPFSGGLVRENYFKFTFGVNLFDIWFQQPRYD
ncbi:MAG: hypothetical protein K6F58_03270 [Bacteroidales bacterium]|nr:hypothetical protein [Bacteroidales bacterium]